MSETLLDDIRGQLGQSNTGQAIQMLLALIKSDGRFPAGVARTVQVIESNYNAVRQQEIKGILSFQEAQREYNKLNDSLLVILDEIGSGRAYVAAPAVANRRWWLLGGAAAVVLIAVIAFKLIGRPDRAARLDKQTTSRETPATTPATNPAAASCPTFDAGRLRVLLLPFQNLGDAVARPELVLQTGITDRAGRNDFPVDVELYRGDLSAGGVPDVRAADQLGRQCGADVVVWGLYNKSARDIQVDLRYIFTGKSKHENATGFEKFRDLPALKSGRITRKLDEALFSLCAAMALWDNNRALAKKWLDKIEKPGDLDKQMMSALR